MIIKYCIRDNLQKQVLYTAEASEGNLRGYSSFRIQSEFTLQI